LLVACFSCSLLPAQTTIEPPIVNPGARSLGLGGAFVAVADDATAAWANPSGLMQLVRPEISAEGRSWSEDREGMTANQSNLGFLSFVLPRDTWSVAIYGQTLSSLEFPAAWNPDIDESVALSGLVIANVGVSGAFRLNDSVSIGIGVTAFGGSFTEGDFNPDDINPLWDGSATSKSGATAGLLWTLNDAWAFGASYRSGADFTFDSGVRAVLPDLLAAGARWRFSGGRAILAGELEQLSGIEDRVRVHVGGEWVFLKAKPLIGLRAGAWHDPRGGAVSSTPDGGITDAESVVHTAVGVGIAWKKFQLDLGVDISDRTTIVALSGIYTF
jgi:hypothetical protein